MAVTRGFAASVIFAGVAVGLAAPATATPTMSGHYIRTETEPQTGQSVTDDWYATPCGDGCASLANTPGGPALSQAWLVIGQWTMDTVDDTLCSDNSRVPDAIAAHYAWDPNTLAGTIQNTDNVSACGDPVGFKWTNTLQLRQAP